MNWLRTLFFGPSQAGRTLARQSARARREARKAFHRQMRKDPGLPPLEALR
jgi:hypothetical protein